MGRWRGATFKEYVRNELACFSTGMSSDMKKQFGFVNVSGSAFSDITNECVNSDYAAPIASMAVAIIYTLLGLLYYNPYHYTIYGTQSSISTIPHLP